MVNSRKQKANEGKEKTVSELGGRDAIGFASLLSL